MTKACAVMFQKFLSVDSPLLPRIDPASQALPWPVRLFRVLRWAQHQQGTCVRGRETIFDQQLDNMTYDQPFNHLGRHLISGYIAYDV